MEIHGENTLVILKKKECEKIEGNEQKLSEAPDEYKSHIKCSLSTEIKGKRS